LIKSTLSIPFPFPRRLFHAKNIGSGEDFVGRTAVGFLDDQPFSPSTGGERLVTNTDWKEGFSRSSQPTVKIAILSLPS
jgi:hypothetical protein